MRIVRIEAAERPLEMPKADEVMETHRYVFDGGNSCCVTPAVKHLAGGQCRMIVNYAWTNEPADAETACMQEYMRNMIGMGAPVFLKSSMDRAASERVCDDWLSAEKWPDGPPV